MSRECTIAPGLNLFLAHNYRRYASGTDGTTWCTIMQWKLWNHDSEELHARQSLFRTREQREKMLMPTASSL